MSDESSSQSGREGEGSNRETAAHSQVNNINAWLDDSHDIPLEALAHQQRRAVLSYLRQADDGVATLTELVAYVGKQTAAHTDAGSRSLTDLLDHIVTQTTTHRETDYDTVALELYHSHLPKLADHGLIDYDPRSKTVRYRGGDEVEAILAVISDESLE